MVEKRAVLCAVVFALLGAVRASVASGVAGADEQILSVPMAGVGAFGVDVVFDGRVYRAELRRHSVRAEGFRVLEVRGDGSVVRHPVGGVSTYRGALEGVEGSAVSGWLSPEGFVGAIDMPGETARIMIEPATDGVREGVHRVVRGSTLAVAEHACGGGVGGRDIGTRSLGVGGGCGGELCIAEIACDTDIEFSSDWGGLASARIEAVINGMNPQFERDTGIRHEITTIVIRSGGAGSDPYGATESGAVLTEFSTEWEDNQSAVTRDVALLFSGKDFDGTTVGRAFLSSVCGLGYGVVQDLNTFGRMTDLCAHELGHCWGANHCACAGDAITGYTMNESITGANRFHPSESSPQIVSYRDGALCLSGHESGVAALPFGDNFEGTTPPLLDGVLWTGVDGAVASTLGINEPSGTRSMLISGAMEARSARLDLSAQQEVFFTYCLQRGGGGAAPAITESLVIEYRDADGCWVEIAEHFGTGVPETTFATHVQPLPAAGAQHDGVRIRVRGTAVGGGDWFLDDVAVSSTGALPGSALLLLPGDGAVGVRTDTRLDWNATAHTDTYRLIVDDSAALTSPIIDVELATPRYTPPGGLPAGTVLYWRVESQSAVGTTGSTPSVASFTTFGTQPDSFLLVAPAPGGTVDTTTPTLEWEAAAGATSYRVLVDRFFDFFIPIVDETFAAPESGAVTYVVPEGVLVDGSAYYWRAEAVNLVGSRTGNPSASGFGIDLTPACEGDATGDGVVDVNDLSYVLFRIGEGGEDGGDVDGSGAVDVNDISFVLFRLGSC